MATKNNNKTFEINVKVTADFIVVLSADSLEDALKKANELEFSNVLADYEETIESTLEVRGVYYRE